MNNPVQCPISPYCAKVTEGYIGGDGKWYDGLKRGMQRPLVLPNKCVTYYRLKGSLRADGLTEFYETGWTEL